MNAIEYATRTRSPYPPHWGPAPDDEDRRVGWALSHIGKDIAGRNSLRRATPLRRRYDRDEAQPVIR